MPVAVSAVVLYGVLLETSWGHPFYKHPSGGPLRGCFLCGSRYDLAECFMCVPVAVTDCSLLTSENGFVQVWGVGTPLDSLLRATAPPASCP